MKAPTNQLYSPARIVALVLIALSVAGLAYLRFAPDTGTVSVPAGAKAGDLILQPCSYATENGSYDADCGTLVVPENRKDPGSRLIALPVTRIHARSDTAAEPIFRLEGGPGITNMQWENASRFAGKRDVVLVGYRGVDGSSVLDCPEVESALAHSTDFLGEKSFRAYAGAFRSCADRLTDGGVDLAGYSLTQRVDDLDAARVALGYDRIDLLSESAGTRTAMIYGWRYPTHIHRSVMIGVNPPGHYLWDAKTTDEQIGRYSQICSNDEGCRARTDDLSASMRRTVAHMPDRWLFLPIKESNVRIASFFGLFETTPETAPITGPMTVDSWLSAGEGDPSGLWFNSLAGDLVFPKMFVWGEYAATGAQDAWAADAHYAAGEDGGSILGNPGTDFAWGGGRLGDAWPVSPDDAEYSRVRMSKVETLLVGGELDVSTPPQVATHELLPSLPNGHQVVLPAFGHSGSFWADQPDAGSRLVNTFLDSGRVDDSLYKPARVDFTPTFSQAAIAKIVLGVMLVLVALTLLSLLWMSHRVRRHGSFGRKASALLRSLYPVVLGLGGWFLGALIVMTTLPGVPLDDELLAVLSVGLPIALGVFWAWVPGGSSATARTGGFVAAMTGALVGGWLGFGATSGILAIVTAIVGAATAANLILIVLDILWARSARERVPAAASGASGPELLCATLAGSGR